MIPNPDPRNEWTPFRWIRYKLTGSALKSVERKQLKLFQKTWGSPEDMPVNGSTMRIAEKWNYYRNLEFKYQFEDDERF